MALEQVGVRVVTQGVSQAKADLDKVSQAEKNIGAEADKAATKTGGLSSKLSEIGKVVGIAAAAAAVGGIALAAKGAFQAATDLQNVLAQTNQVIKSTGGVAGVSAQDVRDLANQFENTTPYSDTMVQSAENMILTFTNIHKNIFPDTTKTVLDMSTAFKAAGKSMDVSDIAIQVGKALNDPIKGITALTRVGVTFTQAQKDMIKSMVDAGDTEDAQKLILQELQREFGGSAEAAGKTFSGQLDILKNHLSDIARAVALDVLPSLTKLVGYITDHLPQIESAVGATTSAIATGFSKIKDIFSGLQDGFSKVDWTPITKGLSAMMTAFSNTSVLDATIKLFDSLKAALTPLETPIKNLAVALGGLALQIAARVWTDAQAVIAPVINAIADAIGKLTKASSGDTSVVQKIGGYIDAIAKTINNLPPKVVNDLAVAVGAWLAIFLADKAITGIATTATNLAKFATNVLTFPLDVLKGIIGPAQSLISSFANATSKTINYAVNALTPNYADDYVKWYLQEASKPGDIAKTANIKPNIEKPNLPTGWETALEEWAKGEALQGNIQANIEAPPDQTKQKTIWEKIGSKLAGSMSIGFIGGMAGVAGGAMATSIIGIFGSEGLLTGIAAGIATLAGGVALALTGMLTAAVAIIGWPIILAALAVLLVTGLAIAFHDKIPALASAIGNGLVTVIENLPTYLGEAAGIAVAGIVFYFVGIPALIIKGIVDGLTAGGPSVAAAISGLFSGIGDVASMAVGGIATAFAALPDLIGAVLTPLGTILASIPGMFMAALSAIPGLVAAIPGAFLTAITAIPGILSALPGIMIQIPSAVESAASQVPGIISTAFTQVPGIIAGAMKTAATGLASALSSMVSAIAGTPFGTVVQTIMSDVVSGFKSGWDDVDNLTGGALSDVVGLITDAVGDFVTAGGNLIGGVLTGLTNGEEDVRHFFLILPPKLVTALGNIFGTFENIGEQIVNGIISGLGAVAASLYSEAQSIASHIASILNPSNWIGSPMGIQNWYPYYFNIGMENLAKAANATTVPGLVADAVGGPISSALQSVSNAGYTVTFANIVASLKATNVSGSKLEAQIDAAAVAAAQAYYKATGKLPQNIQGNMTVNPYVNPNGTANFSAIYPAVDASGNYQPYDPHAGLQLANLLSLPASMRTAADDARIAAAASGAPQAAHGGIVAREGLVYTHKYEAIIPRQFMPALSRQKPGIAVDLRGSTFTGTPNENAQAIGDIVRSTVAQIWGRDAFLAGVRTGA